MNAYLVPHQSSGQFVHTPFPPKTVILMHSLSKPGKVTSTNLIWTKIITDAEYSLIMQCVNFGNKKCSAICSKRVDAREELMKKVSLN